MSFTYLRDPKLIYQESFATIRRETDLSALAADEAAMATRVIHACGMPDIVPDLVFGGAVADATRKALTSGQSIFTDVEMVRHGLRRSAMPAECEVSCTLNDPQTLKLANELATTRSAAAVHFWHEKLAGAVVIIGNAPTALFALLELIDRGAPRPAALFAFPVGFVGAIEAKAELIRDPRGLAFATLAGRRGGSAIAAAAFNAVLDGAGEQ
ncbi:MAG: precorrin-8X methylmutase [Hyphomicrobiaceae bacterium]